MIIGSTRAQQPEPALAPSFIAGTKDPTGRFMGGTEMRLLTVHDGRLFAGNGYWDDRPGPEGAQPPQVLVLDGPGQSWRVDHGFAERLPTGRWRDLAVGALAEATFATDGAGRRLGKPVSLPLASTWDLTGAARVFTRDDATGDWAAVTLASDPPAKDFLPRIRAFGTHRDRVTGIDRVFAGQMPRGIFSGAFDASSPGHIQWSAAPELDALHVSDSYAGLNGRLRVSSFAEANGLLYAAVGQQVYERADGPKPSWRLIYTNPNPGHSETGLRGLTTIRNEAGHEVLLTAVEGNAARIVRINPSTGTEHTELDLLAFLTSAWGMQVNYIIAAYNDMTPVRLSGGGDAVIIGLMAFVPRGSPVAPGHHLVDVAMARLRTGRGSPFASRMATTTFIRSRSAARRRWSRYARSGLRHFPATEMRCISPVRRQQGPRPQHRLDRSGSPPGRDRRTPGATRSRNATSNRWRRSDARGRAGGSTCPVVQVQLRREQQSSPALQFQCKRSAQRPPPARDHLVDEIKRKSPSDLSTSH